MKISNAFLFEKKLFRAGVFLLAKFVKRFKMQLCEFKNDSIVVLDVQVTWAKLLGVCRLIVRLKLTAFTQIQLDVVFAVKNNRLVGFIGKLYDALLVHPKKRLWVLANLQL